MSMSRRDLYAMGEPFGDSATQHKVGGGRIYGGGGSGGGGIKQAPQYKMYQIGPSPTPKKVSVKPLR